MVELLGGHCSAETMRPVPHEPPKPIVKSFELPEANSDMRRVFAYLTKQRFIDPQIISHFAHEHKIYEDSKYHNAVFVGMDENGTPKQASVRSTLSFGKTFRITIASSDTQYSFSHFGNDEKLFIFEATIDMLSFITLYQKDWQQRSYIAMNTPKLWRKGEQLLSVDGLIVGCHETAGSMTALVDDADIHTLMIGASGVGKTANFLYPNIEYCCAAGMSFVTTDSRGDLYRNTATIAEKYYGYKISVIDLHNPTRSSGYNMLYLVNKYMDLYKTDSFLFFNWF